MFLRRCSLRFIAEMRGNSVALKGRETACGTCREWLCRARLAIIDDGRITELDGKV
jgi:hypothetical protein